MPANIQVTKYRVLTLPSRRSLNHKKKESADADLIGSFTLHAAPVAHLGELPLASRLLAVPSASMTKAAPGP